MNFFSSPLEPDIQISWYVMCTLPIVVYHGFLVYKLFYTFYLILKQQSSLLLIIVQFFLYQTLSNLKKHITQHGRRKQQCGHCSFVTTFPTQIRSHYRRMHPSQIPQWQTVSFQALVIYEISVSVLLLSVYLTKDDPLHSQG